MAEASGPARPDPPYAAAIRLPAAELVARLRALLGATLVAYLAGVQETRAVRQWAEGTRQIAGAGTQARLRVAYQAAILIAERDDPAVVQAWFQGLNPALADRSPARLLRDGDLDEAGPHVLAAARQFAASAR